MKPSIATAVICHASVLLVNNALTCLDTQDIGLSNTTNLEFPSKEIHTASTIYISLNEIKPVVFRYMR
jgi:hypothetical protein